MRYNDEKYTINGNEVSVTRIDNDYCGNPRYVVHFLSIADTYEEALKISREIGGRVYRAKWYGGGIVFQSYNIEADLKQIIK